MPWASRLDGWFWWLTLPLAITPPASHGHRGVHAKRLCRRLRCVGASRGLLIRPCEVSILFGLSGVIDAKWRKSSEPLSSSAHQTGQGGYVRVTRSGKGSFALPRHRALLPLYLPWPPWPACRAWGWFWALRSLVRARGSNTKLPKFGSPFALKRFLFFCLHQPHKTSKLLINLNLVAILRFYGVGEDKKIKTFLTRKDFRIWEVWCCCPAPVPASATPKTTTKPGRQAWAATGGKYEGTSRFQVTATSAKIGL